MIPRLNAGEGFESYLGRWPQKLCNVPVDVIKNWVFYHNSFFFEEGKIYKLENWTFRKEVFTTREVLEIKHYDSELKHLDHIGDLLIDQGIPGYDTAEFMLEHGTFPCPIIVAHNAGSFKHVKSLEGETMLEPYHLIEGTRRLAFIRGMAKHRHKKLKEEHDVWLATIS